VAAAAAAPGAGVSATNYIIKDQKRRNRRLAWRISSENSAIHGDIQQYGASGNALYGSGRGGIWWYSRKISAGMFIDMLAGVRGRWRRGMSNINVTS